MDIARLVAFAPGHSHACVALALGYQRAGDLPRAREYTMQALATDPRNPVALKNLGAILGKEGDCLRALYYLRRSYEIDPQDPQTVYGLAFAYMELEDMKPAQKHFQAVLEMEAPEELRGLARGPRIDAVFYLLDAMPPFDPSQVSLSHIFLKSGELDSHRLAICFKRGLQKPSR